MADTVDTLIIHNSTRIYSARFTNISDGTGESAVVKVDISTLTGPDGTPPTAVKLLEASWAIQGFVSVRLHWDHTTDDELKVLTGVGYDNYTAIGGLMDPRSTGGTGDILFTTNGGVAGATYDISLTFQLKD